MKKDSLLTWDFKPTNGKAVYSIADEDGRRYVGQTRNLYSRLYSHRYHLNYAYAHPKEWFLYNQKLIRAARRGMHFRAEVLREFDADATADEMLFWEDYYINKYGGIYLSYNIEPSGSWEYRAGKGGRYVLKPKDALAVESCENTADACNILRSITDCIVIDERLLKAMEEIPSGLPSLMD